MNIDGAEMREGKEAPSPATPLDELNAARYDDTDREHREEEETPHG